MLYISTRGKSQPTDIKKVLLSGLAEDGGLYVPEHVPDASDILNRNFQRYTDMAFEIIKRYINCIPQDILKDIIVKSYAAFECEEVVPVKKIGNFYIAELFHGPTLSFKDIALQFLGNLLDEVLKVEGRITNIIGATSGDTGSAAIYGVKGKERAKIFMMYPYGRISKVQELQMTCVEEENVIVIGIKGTFDDCQELVKKLFRDKDFSDRVKPSAVNSINWVRIVAQIVFYFWTGAKVMTETGSEGVCFAVPTGNFGDIFSAYMAYRMGLPVKKLILATNRNDILAVFFNTGIYRKGDVYSTLSPAMDIQKASNFERYLFYRYGCNGQIISELMNRFDKDGCLIFDREVFCDELFSSASVTDEETLATINEVYRSFGYIVDPHTAVGIRAVRKVKYPDFPLICMATAHPAKFADVVFEATGKKVFHPFIDTLDSEKERKVILPVDFSSVRQFIMDNALV